MPSPRCAAFPCFSTCRGGRLVRDSEIRRARWSCDGCSEFVAGGDLPDPPSRFNATARPVEPSSRTDRSAIEDAVERTSGLRFMGWVGPDERASITDTEYKAEGENVFNAGALDALLYDVCAVLAHDETLPPPTLPTGVVLSGTDIIGEEDLGTVELAQLRPGYGIYPEIDVSHLNIPWVVLVPTTFPTLPGATVGSPSVAAHGLLVELYPMLRQGESSLLVGFGPERPR